MMYAADAGAESRNRILKFKPMPAGGRGETAAATFFVQELLTAQKPIHPCSRTDCTVSRKSKGQESRDTVSNNNLF
jgi:hypothetical protein